MFLKLFIAWMVVINFVSFVTIWRDKRKAEKGTWRIQERTLYLFAFFGGIFGHLYGMKKFRHKTRKPSFLIITFFLLCINITWWFLFFKYIA